MGNFGTKQMRPNRDMRCMPSPDMKKLAERVIKAYPDEFGHIEIERVLFLHEISGSKIRWAGFCREVMPPYGDLLAIQGVHVDWIIEFYSCATEGKSDRWLQILMYHELMHIGVDGKARYHDLEEFSDVLHLAGIDWIEDEGLPDIVRKKIRIAA